MMKNRTLFWTLILLAAGLSSCEPNYAPPANEPASIVISQREVSVAAAGGLFTLKVSHNVDYEIRSDVKWITQDMTRAETENLNFSVAPNPSTEARTGRLTFLSTDEPLEREVTVTQAGKIPDPSLDLNRNTVSFVAEGGEQNRKTVVVTSNQNWTAGTSADWLTINPASGGASQTGITVRLTAKSNNSESNRTSTVTFRAKGIQKSLTVTQAGKKAPSVLVETAFGMQLRLVRVEGGTFWMGAQSTDADGRNYDSEAFDGEEDPVHEDPVHQVTLSDDYYIGKYEVTQGQWKAVMGTTVYQQRDKANPSWPTHGVGDNYPMYYVNYYEAQEFVQRLNERTGKRYALPTEAQWEYAARGGNKCRGYKYSGSNSVGSVAWYGGNSGDATHPVGTKSSNELGLYDMSGNVYEWCKDYWYGSYGSGSQTNPSGPSSGSSRVLRGGSWHGDARYCRVSYRNCHAPGHRYNNFGFRLALLP